MKILFPTQEWTGSIFSQVKTRRLGLWSKHLFAGGRIAAILCALAAPLTAETVYQWANLAGQPPGRGGKDGIGTDASFNGPSGIAVDASGNKYVADTANHAIRKITPAGVVTTVAGMAGASGKADGTGAMARFANPTGIVIDASGNLYVADYSNHAIRKISTNWVVTTLAGSAGVSGYSDGTGDSARFYYPQGLALDAGGNLFVTDAFNQTIRKVTPAGVVTTVAGQAGTSGSTDGTGAGARFNYPAGIAADSNSDLYVADQSNHTIRKITSGGVVTTLAGSPGSSGSTDGTGNTARFSGPRGVAVDTGGNVYVADSGNYTIRKIASSGAVTTMAGSAATRGSTDGTGSDARFYSPAGLAVDSSGDVFVADYSAIRRVRSTGEVTTIAGRAAGSAGSADGTGSMAQFNYPTAVAMDADGNTYVADWSNSVIRKVTSAGVVTTLAGSAGQIGSLDGTGNAARFKYPGGIAVDTSGNVYVADTQNYTIRKVTPDGVVTTLAGSAGIPGTADGTSASARFGYPRGLAVDAGGNIFVADSNQNTIRKVSPSGVVTTLAGTAGASGSIDGTGSEARFFYPEAVAVDYGGNVFVADTDNHTIRKVTPAGVVTTLAGSAGLYGNADGVGAAARFKSPSGLAIDGSANLFVADSGNYLIRKVTADGSVTTIYGITESFERWTYGHGSIAVGAGGKLVVADRDNHRIAVGTPAGARPVVKLTPVSAVGGTTATLNGQVIPNGLASTCLFEYGDSPLYGQTASVVLSPDDDALFHDVSTTLTGLTLNATYYYRLTATNADGAVSTTGMFTTMVPPTFTCPLAATAARLGQFGFSLVADQSPVSYGASGLPHGLSFNPYTGRIEGNPDEAPGTYLVTITASNAAGTTTETLALTLVPVSRDLIVAQPATHNVLRFDAITGAFKGVFIAAGAGGLVSPAKMVPGPDGKLYIADSSANVVKRFDHYGNYLDDFVPAGNLTNPVSLQFGPDGNLYVLCSSTRQIRRFNGTTGAYEGLVVNALATQLSSPKDFTFMPFANDFLVTSSLNTVTRFRFTTGVFISFYLNPTKSVLNLSSPMGIIVGPDGNYWVASSTNANKVTRFSSANGAKINDAFIGPALTGGHQEIQYENGYLYVANGSGNNILIYDAYEYMPENAPPPSSGSSSAWEFIPAGSNGLTNPKNLLFFDIPDPPVVNAGADATVSVGESFSLNGSAISAVGSLTYTWTQISGPTVLTGPASGAVLNLTAPAVPQPMTFLLTVSDGNMSVTDTVTISVTGPNIALEAPTGTAPVANGAGTLGFGPAGLGQSSDMACTLRNTGSTDLTGIVPTITGTDAGQFTLVSAPPSSLAAGASAEFTVRFSPTTLGVKTATLSIASNDPDENPFTLALTGTGADMTPPQVVSWSFANDPISASGGSFPMQEMLVRIKDASGFSYGGISIHSVWAAFDSSQRISGTAQDGIYRVLIPIPANDDSVGTWSIGYFDVTDIAGNRGTLYPDNFPPGSPVSFQATGDFTAPWIESLAITPDMVNVQDGPATCVIEMHITDAGFGFSDGWLKFTEGSFGSDHFLSVSAADRISGTAQDGVYRVGLTIPQGTAGPMWYLQLCGVNDPAGNMRNYSDGSWGAGGMPFPPGTPMGVQIQDPPDISVSGNLSNQTKGSASLGFAPVAVNQNRSESISFGNNSGSENLSMITYSLEGPDASQFFIDPFQPPPPLFRLGPHEGWWLGINFAPTSPGTKTATLLIYTNDPDESPFTITLSGNALTTTEAWRQSHFNTTANSGNAADDADPDHDGLSNLLERAFNLNPTQAGRPILVPGIGTSGLPNIQCVGTGAICHLKIEYLRLKTSANPGITYAPQFSSDLIPPWQDFTGTETVESINSEWERVTVEDTATGQARRFGRVMVSPTQ